MIFSFLLGGLACVFYYLAARGGQVWTYLCLLLGKFGIASAFFMMHLLTVESVPTVYRGTVFGMCSIFARTGGALAPLTDGFASNYFMYLYGGFGIFSAICPLFIRETNNEEMADSEEEARKLRATLH